MDVNKNQNCMKYQLTRGNLKTVWNHSS